MDGRQQQYGNYGGNMPGSGYPQSMRYGRGLGGMAMPYGAAPQAMMPQQMGVNIPGLNLPYGAQPGLQMAEDPSLYVNFDEEEIDFSSARRIPVSFPQQPQRRPSTSLAQPHPPLQTSAVAGSLPQSRPASAGAAKPASAADKELADLKRRIAEKERQMKAKRQSAQSNAAGNNVTRFNPAHGPVLRGLHRKQSPGLHNSSEQQVESFLKEVTADLAAQSSGKAAPPTAAKPQPSGHAKTAPSRQAQLLAQAAKQASNRSSKAPAKSAKSPEQQKQQQQSLKAAATPPATQLPSESQVLVSRFRQPSRAAPALDVHASDQKAKAAAKVDRSPVKQPSTQTGKQAAKANGMPSRQAKQQPKPIANGDTDAKRGASGSKPAVKASGVPAAVALRQDEAARPDSAGMRQPPEGASDSDAGGVAVQSGYHMSDSPLLQSSSSEGEDDLSAQPAVPSVPALAASSAAANSATVLAPADKMQAARALANTNAQLSTVSASVGQAGKQPVAGLQMLAAAGRGAGATWSATATPSQHALTSLASQQTDVRNTGKGSSERAIPTGKAGQKRSAPSGGFPTSPAVLPTQPVKRRLAAYEPSQGRRKAHKTIHYDAIDAAPATLAAGDKAKTAKVVSKPDASAASLAADANSKAVQQPEHGTIAATQLGGQQSQAARGTAQAAANPKVPERLAFAAPISAAAALPPAQTWQSASSASQKVVKTAELPLSTIFGRGNAPPPSTQPASSAQQTPSSSRLLTASTNHLVGDASLAVSSIAPRFPSRQMQAAAVTQASAAQAASVSVSVADPSSPEAHPAVATVLQQRTASPHLAAAAAQCAHQAASSIAAASASAVPGFALGKAAAVLPGEPPLPSDSGEDMDIDEEEKWPLPPLPPLPPVPEGSASPSMLQLATINSSSSSHDLVALTADEQQGLLNELSSIHTAKDELRIQKRLLNDMFAKLKQDYLEKRLREQQIKQVLGDRPHVALPNSAEPASDTLPLALLPAGQAQPAGQLTSATGDSRQTRRAELQSRAELHQARMDALHARARQPGSAMPAFKKAADVGLSPMTRKAIHDLTAAQAATASSSEAVHTRTDAALSAAATASPRAAADDCTDKAAAASKQALAKGHAATASANHAGAKVAETAKPSTSVKAPAADKAAKSVIKPADRQDSKKDRSAVPQQSTSRQAHKRRRSSSTSTSPVRAADSRASKGRTNAAGHADGTSQRRRTRSKSRSRSPAPKRSRQQAASIRTRHRSPSSSSTSLEVRRRRPAADSTRPRQQAPHRSPVARRRRSPSPKARGRDPVPSTRGLVKQASSRPRPGNAPGSPSRNLHKGGSPTRQKTSPNGRHGNDQRSPVRKQASTQLKSSPSRSPLQTGHATARTRHDARGKQQLSSSSSRSPRRNGPSNADREHMSQAQQQNHLQAPGKALQGSDTPHIEQESKTAPAAQLGALLGNSSIASRPTARQAGYMTGDKPASADTLHHNVTKEPQPGITEANGPSGSVEAVSLGVAAVKSESSAKLAPGAVLADGKAEHDVIDITADDTDLSQVSQDVKQAAAPAAAADHIMTDAQHVSIATTAADTAEAFISLDDDNDIPASQPRGLGAVSHEQSLVNAKPPQTQRASMTARTARSAQPTAAAAAAFTDRAEQEGVRLGVVAASKAKQAVSANGGPLSARDAVQPAAVPLQQRPALAAKAKTAGKGGIQILVATKHKEEAAQGGFPFPSLFGALAAQGLPKQGSISAEVLHPIPPSIHLMPASSEPGQYQSPLQAFRSYRLLETFETVSQLSFASPSFSHKPDPQWPLCTYDIRGSCRDAKCAFQHASDYELENLAVLRNLHSQATRAGAHAALPALPGGEISAVQLASIAKQIVSAVPDPHIMPASSDQKGLGSLMPARPQQRIPKDRRRQVASEEPLPSYVTHSTGSSSLESHPFQNQLLSSVTVEHDHMPWLLLAGWEGYESLVDNCTVPRAGGQASEGGAAIQAALKLSDKSTGRYFRQTDQPAKAVAVSKTEAKTAASEAQAERDQALASMEQALAKDPSNDQLWVLSALQHIDFGAVESLKGPKLMSCLRHLSKGLEANSSSTRLWLLYLPLYNRYLHSKGDTRDAVNAAGTCLSHSKHSYQLWLTAVQLQPTWQSRALLLQQGIVALAQTDAAQYEGLPAEEVQGWATMRSGCVLDMALRLLLLWTSADRHDLAASWVADLVKLARSAAASNAWGADEDALSMEERSVPAAARQALLHQVQDQPANAAVLWLTCAHLVACNSLPDCTVHTLGHSQHPAVLKWQQVPPASCHARVRGVLATAAGPGLGCLGLTTKPEIADMASIKCITAAAWPKQALALSIAHWQLATQCDPVMASTARQARSGAPHMTPEAHSLLFLAHVTSKAVAHLQQPLPPQVMEAWQHATWPTGHLDLLTMGMVTAAELPLQVYIDTASQAAQQAPDIAQKPSQFKAPGRLQQLVLAAADLLAGIAQRQASLQLSRIGTEALDGNGTHEMDPAQLQHETLQPAVVGALATRAYQLSNGSVQCALAILVTAALPDVSSAPVPPPSQPPWDHFEAAEHQGAAEAMQRQDCAATRSRNSPSTPSGRQEAASQETSNLSGTSSSSDFTSDSGSSTTSPSSRSSSSSSSGGSQSTQDTDSMASVRQSSGQHRPQGGSGAFKWADVEATGSLGSLQAVRTALLQLTHPAERSQSPQELEEGEIAAADEHKRRTDACYSSLNLALYQTLSGACSEATLQAAGRQAAGNLHLEGQLWQEHLSFASAVLSPGKQGASSLAAATPQDLHSALQSLSLRQKLQLLQQYSAWHQRQATLEPLALPKLPLQDKRAKALLEQPKLQDQEQLKETFLMLLANAPAAEEHALVEALASGTPSSAARAQLLLDLAARRPQDAQYAAWILPLAAGALLNAAPCASHHLWLQAVVLAEKHSQAAALELCTIAVARHPFSSALLKRHSALKGSPQTALTASS